MTQSKVHFLFAKKMAGEASDAEERELDALMSEDAEMRESFRLLTKYWEGQDNGPDLYTEEALQKVLTKLEIARSEPTGQSVGKLRQIRVWLTSLAAAAVLFLVIVIALRDRGSSSIGLAHNRQVMEQKSNPKGTKSTIELPDGSKVWLNADSRISYPASFAGKDREISLVGEAYFEVAHDASKPFIIRLDKGTVRVLGTSFNVKAYPGEKVVETSVTTGKVAFIPKYSKGRLADTLFITPNNKVRFTIEGEHVNIGPTIASEDKAWTQGALRFEALTLEEIAVELERSFDKKVIIRDEILRTSVFTGSFKNNSLDEIMFYLSLSKSEKFNYRITNKELIISLSKNDD